MIGKRMKFKRFGAAVVTTSVLLGSCCTWADTNDSQLVAADKAHAAAIAQKQYGGKVLKVNKVSQNGSRFFSVRLILEDGRVKTLKIAAK